MSLELLAVVFVSAPVESPSRPTAPRAASDNPFAPADSAARLTRPQRSSQTPFSAPGWPFDWLLSVRICEVCVAAWRRSYVEIRAR